MNDQDQLIFEAKPKPIINWSKVIRRVKWIVGGFFLTFLLIFVIGLAYFSKGLPSIEDVTNYQPSQRTTVYDRHQRMIHSFYEENREWVPLEHIPADLKQAIVYVEDVRFYQHWGLDARRLFGALIKDIIHFDFREGASTITMQLARNAFLTQEKKLSRKIRELLLALKLERTLTKPEILELYLNQIYFGSGCYGVQTVSKRYFDKPISQLNRAQCTFLAGLPKNPEGYNPLTNLERGKNRQKIVLRVLARNGYIEPTEVDTLWNRDLEVVHRQTRERTGSYFLEEIRKYLIENYGPEFVYYSGARVFTTLDQEWQAIADSVFTAHFNELDGYIHPADTTNTLQGALLALDPQTAGIVALVGGRNFGDSQFNRALQAQRQPGSAFKPIVYAEAIRQGFSPADVILDQPDTIYFDNQSWSPRNITRKYSGSSTLRDALNRSLNAAAVYLLQQVGINNVIALAESLQFKSHLPPYPSLALGSASVTVQEMVAAFNTFNHKRIYNKPYLIEKIVDTNGLILASHEPHSMEILTEPEAAVMVSMLRSVVDNGSGYNARWLGFDREAAGKTGTTTDYKDGWFVGFTPQVTCGVWGGFNSPESMGAGWGSTTVALPLWTKFMIAVHDSLPIQKFELPINIDHVTICQRDPILRPSRTASLGLCEYPY